MIEKKIKVTTHEKQAEENRAYMHRLSPDERLDMVEAIRIQWCKHMGIEYPTPMVKVIRVIRCDEGMKDSARGKN
jgi:hypothetical protein